MKVRIGSTMAVEYKITQYDTREIKNTSIAKQGVRMLLSFRFAWIDGSYLEFIDWKLKAGFHRFALIQNVCRFDLTYYYIVLPLPIFSWTPFHLTPVRRVALRFSFSGSWCAKYRGAIPWPESASLMACGHWKTLLPQVAKRFLAPLDCWHKFTSR